MIAHLITAAEALMWVWITVAVIFAAACLAVAPTAEQRVERMTEEGLRATRLPLPHPTASDDEFAAWSLQAIGLANEAAFDNTLRDIRALKTTEDIA